jgi:hypothetical protein
MVKFVYKTARGKGKIVAQFFIDEAGNLARTFVSSPHVYAYEPNEFARGLAKLLS